MQAGILDEVFASGGGNGGDVANVLHHRGDGNGSHDQNGGEVELGDSELLQAEGACLMHGGEIDLSGDQGNDIAAGDAEQNGNDLDHALTPDIGSDDDRYGKDCEPPAGPCVFNGGAGEVETDHDDHGAGNDGREVAHDLLDAEELKEEREYKVQQACDHNAAERIGQLFAAHAGVFAGIQIGNGLKADKVGE